MVYEHNTEKHLKTRFAKINKMDKFKYLGEWIHSNGLRKKQIKVKPERS